MASFPGNTVFILSLTLVFVHFGSTSAARIGIKATGGDIQDICSSAPDPPSCLHILNSLPRNPKTDLIGIASLAIDLAEKTTKDTILFTNFLTEAAQDEEMQARYVSCNKYFNSVVDALGKARKSLHSGDLYGLHEAAIEAVEFAQSCEDLFDAMPSEPTLLPQKTEQVINHSGVVFALAQKGPS